MIIFWQFLPRPQGPWGAEVLKFTVNVPLAPKMLHINFDKDWNGSHEEIQNVQLFMHDG